MDDAPIAAVRPGTQVFVDGFNFFDAIASCFGSAAAKDFYLPGLADLLGERASLPPVVSISVYIGTLNDELVSPEKRQFWRDRLPALRTQERVRVQSWPNKPHARFTCPACKHHVGRCARCGEFVHGKRSAEKGIDVAFAVGAMEAALVGGALDFIFFCQDKDQAPLIQSLKSQILRRGDRYTLFSAFPVCGSSEHDHEHLPGTKKLPGNKRPGLTFDRADFSKTARPQ